MSACTCSRGRRQPLTPRGAAAPKPKVKRQALDRRTRPACSPLAPNTRRTKLAAAGGDRVIHLFDESGARRDRFRTKPADGNASGAYLITGLTFSPDGAKLAVAQSDCVVFVYRWEGHAACNRLPCCAGHTAAWDGFAPSTVQRLGAPHHQLLIPCAHSRNAQAWGRLG